MMSFNSWQRDLSDPSCMADKEENSYTRALHRNKSPDLGVEQQQQTYSELQVNGEETSQCTEKRSADSDVQQRDAETNVVERIMNEQDPEQCLVHSRPDIVGGACNESSISHQLMSPNTPDSYKISERSCTTFDGSASINSNASSEMNMTTEQADDAYCCHTFRYDESWSVHSGTVSNVSEYRADSPISLFAPASTIQFGTRGHRGGDNVSSGSTLSGLTTAPSAATGTHASSMPEDCSVRINAVLTRDSDEFKEGTEVNLDAFPLFEEDENTGEEIKMAQATDMDTVETEDAHYVEYVEEMASSDIMVDHKTQVTEQDQSKVGEMLEDEGCKCAPRNTQDLSSTSVNYLGRTRREDDLKTSFIKKFLPKQRPFDKKGDDSISINESLTTLILQVNNDVQLESDQFEMICASSDDALVTAKAAYVESEPLSSDNHATKKTMISHVRSGDTDSTKDISVFTMRSVNSESTEAKGGAIAGMFSLGVASFQRNKRFADSAACTIEDSSLYLHEEVVEGGEEREQAVLTHDSDYVDESLNVEINEEDFFNSPHFSKNVNSEQALTKVHKISILPRLAVFSGKNSDDVKVKAETVAIRDSAPRNVSNIYGARKNKWTDMRMKFKR